MLTIAVDARAHPQDWMARVLVVEGEPLLAIMLDNVLSDFGYHIIGPVENLKAATHLAATEHLDAAVVDINIDGEIAEGVADNLMKRGIPFVFVNGHARMFSLNYSAIPRLQKPFTVDDLQRTIMRLLQRAAEG